MVPISDEFSESKNLGLALFTWVQVLVVGLPSFFLVDASNYQAKYFLVIGFVFVLTESMLLVIFVPLMMATFKLKNNPPSSNRGGQVAVTGLNMSPGMQRAEQTNDLAQGTYENTAGTFSPSPTQQS